MEENKTNTVRMTDAEMEAYKAFQAEQARKNEQERAKKMREDYTAMVDEQIAASIPQLKVVSSQLAEAKKAVMDNFKAIIELKGEIFRMRKGEDLGVKSHTFTNTDGNMRITIGNYQLDGYLDTAEDGIAMVREYIESLASDEKSQALVRMVMQLLAKDAKGTLKASRIIQLRKLANESGDRKFIEGVEIIEEAYTPVNSKTFVTAEVKGENGQWVKIPLGMTES